LRPIRFAVTLSAVNEGAFAAGAAHVGEATMRKIGLWGFALLVLALGIGRAHAEPLQIRAAWVAPISDWISIWLDKKDLATHYGKSYVLESIHYTSTPPMVTAMVNGELEIAMLAFSTFPIAVVNAGMDDMRVIADEFQDGVEGYYSDEFMVLKDGPIKEVEDLKGKIVATNAAGSAVDVAMKAMLHKHGLEQNRDYTEIEAPFPAMRAMLAEKKVDLISAVLPFSLDPELKKIAAPLFTSRDAVGVTQFIMFTARKPFIDKNRAALVDWLEDSLRILRWYKDPNNHRELEQIAGRLLKAPPERFSWVFTKQDEYRDVDMLPNLAALQKNVDLTHELGFVKSSFDVKAHSDLSLVEEAAKRLK
jgi:sulfonate transport system substrate-binding protein